MEVFRALEQPALRFGAQQGGLRRLAQYAEDQRNQQDLQHERGRGEFSTIEDMDNRGCQHYSDQADGDRDQREVPNGLTEGGSEPNLIGCILGLRESRE